MSEPNITPSPNINPSPDIDPSQISQENTANVSAKKRSPIIVALVLGCFLIMVLCGVGISICLKLFPLNIDEFDLDDDYLALSKLYVEPDDTNPDYWFEDGVDLPFSYSFTSKVLLRQRLLTYSDGYGSEIIAFGGYPELYNFSILKPTTWTRTIMEPDNYELTSPSGESQLGVRLFPSGTTTYAEYSNCKDEVEKIFTVNIEESVTISRVHTLDVTVDGKDYERVDYFAEYEDYYNLYGLDQCYKDSNSLFIVYVVISENDYAEYFDDRELILDDFIWDEI